MKLKTKLRKIVKRSRIARKKLKIVNDIAKRVPLASLPVAIVAPVVRATEIDQSRSNRAWFQMAKDKEGKIQARIDALRSKCGYATMNDMAAAMFESLCEKHGV